MLLKFLLAAPGAPLDLTLRAENTSSVVLSWGKPTKPNGIIIEYQVNYVGFTYTSDVKDEQSTRTELDIVDGYHSYSVSSSELKAVIIDLKSGLFYNFTVSLTSSLLV